LTSVRIRDPFALVPQFVNLASVSLAGLLSQLLRASIFWQADSSWSSLHIRIVLISTQPEASLILVVIRFVVRAVGVVSTSASAVFSDISGSAVGAAAEISPEALLLFVTLSLSFPSGTIESCRC
jgi:hypothetical protein